MRTMVLFMIATEAEKTREQMGIKGHFTVQGLQSPVIVREFDETRVELSLNYSVSLDWTE